MLESEFLLHRMCLCREEANGFACSLVLWFIINPVVPTVVGEMLKLPGQGPAQLLCLQSPPAPQRHLSLHGKRDGMAPWQRGLTVAWETLGKLCSLFLPLQQCHGCAGSLRDCSAAYYFGASKSSAGLFFFPLSVYAAPAASTVLCFRPGTGETLSISQKEPMGRTAPGSCLCQGFFPFL